MAILGRGFLQNCWRMACVFRDPATGTVHRLVYKLKCTIWLKVGVINVWTKLGHVEHVGHGPIPGRLPITMPTHFMKRKCRLPAAWLLLCHPRKSCFELSCNCLASHLWGQSNSGSGSRICIPRKCFYWKPARAFAQQPLQCCGRRHAAGCCGPLSFPTGCGVCSGLCG